MVILPEPVLGPSVRYIWYVWLPYECVNVNTRALRLTTAHPTHPVLGGLAHTRIPCLHPYVACCPMPDAQVRDERALNEHDS